MMHELNPLRTYRLLPLIVLVCCIAVGIAGHAVALGSTPTTVNVAVWGQFIEPDGPQPNLQEHLKLFDHPDIEVNLLVVPGTPTEYAEKVLVMLATLGDEAPDLFIFEPEDANSAYVRGVAMDLGPFFQSDPEFADEILFVDEYHGKIVGIPGSVYIEPLAYNAAAVEAAGLEDPNSLFRAGRWDLETFAQHATRVTRREGDDHHLVQIGFLGTAADAFNTWPFIHNFGGRVMSEDGLEILMNSEETIAAYDWMVTQVVRDAIVIAEFEAPGTYERRGFGDVVFGQGSPAAYHLGLFPYLPEYVPYPEGPAGRYTMASFQPWMIRADSPRAEAAWEILKFIVTKQAEHQMHYLGNIPNQRSLVRPHITMQLDFGQSRTDVEAVWNETMATFTSKPRYAKPELRLILTEMSRNVLGGRIGVGEAIAEVTRQIRAILAEE